MRYTIKRRLRNDLWPLLSVAPSAVDTLIERLNDGTDREGEELRELVRDFNRIDEIGRTHGFPHVNVYADVLHPEAYPGFDASSVKRLKKIRAAFRSYRPTPLPAYPQEGGWKFYWLHPWGIGWIYLAKIHDFAAAGLLRRVRECDHCSRWFFGRRNDQRFCLDRNCREKHWRTSAAGRATRADYMRGYRQRLKRKEQNSLKAPRDRARKERLSHRR